MKRYAFLALGLAVALAGCSASTFTSLPMSAAEVIFDSNQPPRGKLSYIESGTVLRSDGEIHEAAVVARAGRQALRKAGFEISQDVTIGENGHVIGKKPVGPLDHDTTMGVYFHKVEGGYEVKALMAREPNAILAHETNLIVMRQMEEFWRFWATQDMVVED